MLLTVMANGLPLIQDELGNISSDLKSAGFSNDTIQKVLEQQYKMLDKLNVPYDRISIL